MCLVNMCVYVSLHSAHVCKRYHRPLGILAAAKATPPKDP